MKNMWLSVETAVSDGTPCELMFADDRGTYQDAGPFFLHGDGRWYRIDPPMQEGRVPTHYRPLWWLLEP